MEQYGYGVRAEAISAWRKLNRIKRFLSRRFGWKWYVGTTKPVGFVGATPFYVFWCRVCGRPAKDYPHGFLKSRHFICRNCNARHEF